MTTRRSISFVLLCFIMFWTTLPVAFGLDTKYMQFREITIDGDDTDWNGIDPTLLISSIRIQEGRSIVIASDTFTPGNITVKQGTSVIWNNLDPNTNATRKHQIALGVEAPITWTSNALSFGDSDFLITEDIDNFTYHTSRVNFVNYPNGNITVIKNEFTDLSYSIFFASSPSFLYMGISILNLSNEVGQDLYLKEIDVVMDDFGDNSIEGENAFRISKSLGGYDATDRYYSSGFLVKDTDDQETEDIEMAFSHQIPEGGVNYLGDFFLEVKIPINTISLRDIGSSVGTTLGIEIIVKVSDTQQDIASSLLGVRNIYEGGGYPIFNPYDISDINRLDVDPNEFLAVRLSGDDFFLIISTIFEEIWIFLLSTIAIAFSLIFGGIVRIKKQNKKNRLCKDDGICNL